MTSPLALRTRSVGGLDPPPSFGLCDCVHKVGRLRGGETKSADLNLGLFTHLQKGVVNKVLGPEAFRRGGPPRTGIGDLVCRCARLECARPLGLGSSFGGVVYPPPPSFGYKIGRGGSPPP